MAFEPLIQLLVYLLIGGVIIYIFYWILGMIALPQPAKQIVLLIVGLAILLWLLRTVGIV